MTTIELVANDQLLQVTVNPKISSGEVNTVGIHVDFSDEWNGFGKNAVFYTSYNSRDIYEIVMTNNECIVPSEVMKKSGTLYIGIRGVNDNKVKTTSLVKLKILEGTPTGNSTEVEPTPDVYEQLLTAYGKTDNAIAVERARIDTFTALPEGSTVGNAELADIRVGTKGQTYPTAGNAVREQIGELKDDLDALNQGGLVLKENFISQQVEGWLNKHPEATTTVQDKSISANKLTDEFKTSLRNNYINVLDYGAKGDGFTDDTSAIKSAVNDLTDNSTLFFPSGRYRVTIGKKYDDVISITELNNVVILGENAHIEVNNNKYTDFNVIFARNCNNLIIDGLYIIGDRLEHDYSTISGTHEFGYGIFILGDDSNLPVNVEIKNCNISEMTGDAIVTKNGISGGEIYIHDCKIRKCRRQGISVLDSDRIVIRNVDIQYIGTFDGITGAHPMSCIDIEPASGSHEVQSVIIDGCTLKHASTYALVGNPDPNKNGYIHNMFIANTELSDATLTLSKKDLYEPKIINCKFITDTARRQYFKLTDFEIYNCVFDVQHGTPDPKYTSTIWCKGIYNSHIRSNRYEGSDSIASYLVLRGCIVNSVLDSVQISSNNSNPLSVCKGNTFTNCSFLFYTTPPVIQNCTFEGCFRSPGNDPTVKYANCVLDTKIFTNTTLYNSTILNEV